MGSFYRPVHYLAAAEAEPGVRWTVVRQERCQDHQRLSGSSCGGCRGGAGRISEPQRGPRALLGHLLSFHGLSETPTVFCAGLAPEFTNIVVRISKSVRFVQKRAFLCVEF